MKPAGLLRRERPGEIRHNMTGKCRRRAARCKFAVPPQNQPARRPWWRRLAGKKGRDHSRPLRCSAWRRYHVRRDISSLSQGFLASMVRGGPSSRGRPVLRGRVMPTKPSDAASARPARLGAAGWPPPEPWAVQGLPQPEELPEPPAARPACPSSARSLPRSAAPAQIKPSHARDANVREAARPNGGQALVAGAPRPTTKRRFRSSPSQRPAAS